MIENDYVDLCNLASRLNDRVDQHIDKMSLEDAKNLAGFLRIERQAAEKLGGMPAVYVYLEARLQEEITFRERPRPKSAPFGMRDNSDLPF